MKTIGLIGGLSWESSAQYYRLLNEGVRARLGGLHSARILLLSLDFAPIAALQASGDWDVLDEQMADAARSLAAGGAEMLLIGANTMHLCADAVKAASDVPLLHIADPAIAAVRAAGFSRVGLLGTAFTMEKPFYTVRMAAAGIAAIIPGEADRAIVHRIIYDELVQGVVRDASRAEYRRIIAALIADGAEAIVLGCTEIMLLVGEADSAVPMFDTLALHVDAAIEAALAP
ncbi:aspartate/glutamate racemase family protein [Sphingopyxis sp. RIFCSPHIGHO2_12_FULL_65_19]|uniref:aspartate/glutamate racemase family protein n=1 Tax=Sphingopyxis sp. RIFCSPHIGHO2_12_FULL_65_19 TaxID=1802172 RepID=UPI0008AAEA80|nr:aspartate/glutamate racemase family protein [Sphingopyxis sp. RIFCSPHIGHO2_12_FULL_65_19]OHD08853.1 MAG: aspartate/glutamate racemase [Sphingopyxis sp. RIFCSPHIGHO2_12_FULL_65_19]